MGEESGSCVVIDCMTGDLLCLASMPAYDPNSFSDGIGQTEWKVLGRRPAQAVGQQGPERALPARLDDQADGRDGHSGPGHRPQRDGPLLGRLPARQPLLPLPRPPRHGQHAARHRQELQHLFLFDGQPHRLRQYRAGREDARPRPEVRSAGRQPELRHRPRQRVEEDEVRDQPEGRRAARLDSLGHAQRLDRPGLPDPEPAAARR